MPNKGNKMENNEENMGTTERNSDSTLGVRNKKFVFMAEDKQCFFKPSDKSITIVCSGGSHDRGSSKIKLINVINFKWEQKNYPGRLIACHKDCNLIAYSIRVTKQSKSEGMVRVALLGLPDRGLIKGLSDEILDLQFAHTSAPDCLLAIIERTALHVHQILVQNEKVTTSLKVKIVDPIDGHIPVCDRVTWCPYVGDGGDEIDDFAKQLLVWTRGSTFQCYSINALTKSYLDTTDMKASDIEEGGFKANDGDAVITGSVFSDDGTTLALSSSDGFIRFYQVYQHANDHSPRRLHLWKPHDGKAITSFFFLDNYTETVNNKTIWKHAITCAENNTEIKVWCCESWECLQTVRLMLLIEHPLRLKAEIDISSTYLVLSDQNIRQLYVLQIRKGQTSGSPASETVDTSKSASTSLAKEKPRSAIQPYIVSIAEYPMSTSILGFGILYATVGKSKYGDYYMMREQDDDDDDQSLPSCVLIRMFLVQPNNLQDCTLMYDAVQESECDPPEMETGEPEQDVDATESQVNSSSVSSSSSSNETTDNNVSHPPSEEDERSLEDTATTTTATKPEINNGEPSSHKNGSANPQDEEEDPSSSDPITLKMTETAQKLNEAFVAIRAASSSMDGVNPGGSSAPPTPGSATKVNLMTPDSFSTPASGSRSAAKDGSKEVRIINLSELPYPEMESIINQYDRRSGRGGRGAAATNTTTATTTTTGGSVRKNNSSITSTASANGSLSSSDTSSNDEREDGGGNTSVASVAGSERIANITDDPDDDGEEEIDVEAKVVMVKAKTKKGKIGHGLANGAGESSIDRAKCKKATGGILNISASLNIEHFSKILTLDEAEPPTVREKNKNDETVNPDVLSTLFMLAKATKHQQPPAGTVPELMASVGQNAAQPTVLPTTDALEAFVNMVKSRSESTEDSGGKTKARKSTNGPSAVPEDSISGSTVPPMPSADMLASGGSSPSREVQQIMSTKGPVINMVDDMFMYSCVERKDGYEEDEDDEQEGVVNVSDRFDEEDGVVANGTEDNADEIDTKEPSSSLVGTVVTSSEEKEAETVPVLSDRRSETMEEPKEGAITASVKQHENPAQQKMNVLDANQGPSSNFWPSNVPTELPAGTNDVKKLLKSPATPANDTFAINAPGQASQIEELHGKMDRLMEVVLLQSRQITLLNDQLETMKKSRSEEFRRTSAMINRINQTLPKAVETQINEQFGQQKIKLEEAMFACFNSQQQNITDSLMKGLPIAILSRLPAPLMTILMRELQEKLIMPIGGKLTAMQRAFSMELGERLLINERAMRDAIERTIRSEPVLKAVSMSVQSSMSTVFEQVYKESLRTIILPSYDKCSQEMFRQLNISFSEGIKEVMRKVDNHVGRVARTQDRANELVDIIRQLPEKLAANGERTTATALRAIRDNIEKDLKTPLLKTIRDNIRQEIEKGFEVQASSLEYSVRSMVSSQAQTPAPTDVDVQDQIKQYLSCHQINKAFHKALLSNDLSLVEFVLERADHKLVFNPCALEQTVLLSLIQQISADMANHNELKHKYLSDAIVSLDFKDPITKEHWPKVIMELINNCQSFVVANPSSPLCTSLKMVVVAAQYMGLKNV